MNYPNCLIRDIYYLTWSNNNEYKNKIKSMINGMRHHLTIVNNKR